MSLVRAGCRFLSLTLLIGFAATWRSEARAQAPPVPRASLVLRGGRVVTMDERRPMVEGVAMIGGKIVAVGSDEEMAAWIGPTTRVIELDGRFAMPGFIECHGHLLGLGRLRMDVDLTAAKSWDEVIALVAERARGTPVGDWVIGRGWHQSLWSVAPSPDVEGYPVHAELSAAISEHPVMLVHRSGHAAMVNELGLGLAGVTSQTVPEQGGEILHDDAGKPTGMLREAAQDMANRAIARWSADRSPATRREEFERAVELASRECLSKGVTSFQDAGVSFETLDALIDLNDRGRLHLRMWIMLRAGNAELAEKLPRYARSRDQAGARLVVGGIKKMMDGALGAHGAWMLEPYADLPTSRGLRLTSDDDLLRAAAIAHQHDLQLCTHAIGDRANRQVLDLYERFQAEHPEVRDRRWRIEHAQHLSPTDIPRYARLGVIASMQGNHCATDGLYAIARLGHERAANGAYAWQPLLASGAIIANGTDAPVEDVSPIASFAASVTRRMPNGETFFPEHRMTREQALRSYTVDAAYAARQEEVKGALFPGAVADVVVLSHDLLTIADEEVPRTRVEYTILDGEVVYTAEGIP